MASVKCHLMSSFTVDIIMVPRIIITYVHICIHASVIGNDRIMVDLYSKWVVRTITAGIVYLVKLSFVNSETVYM